MTDDGAPMLWCNSKKGVSGWVRDAICVITNRQPNQVTGVNVSYPVRYANFRKHQTPSTGKCRTLHFRCRYTTALTDSNEVKGLWTIPVKVYGAEIAAIVDTTLTRTVFAAGDVSTCERFLCTIFR